MKTFTCTSCLTEYDTDQAEWGVVYEMEQNFPGDEHSQIVEVCEECFNECMIWCKENNRLSS